MSVRLLARSVLALGALMLTAAPIGSASADTAVTSPVGGPELASVATVVHLAPGVPAPPTPPAKAYLLADLTTGQILVAHDVHRRLLTASTMKVLTALTLLPRLDQSQVYRATAADADADGSKVGIVAGARYTVHQLFLGMMLSSGNDAANSLADAAGGVPTTVGLMQREASSLGAYDTTVRDPSGLDAPGQRSSAYDLALIARAAMERPDFRALVATKTATFPGGVVKGKRVKAFQIQNHNELLSHYRGAIGVKTGYTVAARWTYIGAARRSGHTYLVTEMGLSQAGWLPASKLLDWAFAHGPQVAPVGHLVTAADLASAAATPAPTSGSGADAQVTDTGRLTTGSRTTRLLGFAGLAGAVAIVGTLGLTAVRRRARR